MSKKKGLSLEEKRSKILEIFYDKKDCFQLKELEKFATKEKKINSQIVKEILQTLVDDDLINSEKIGTSIYFWAFPSRAGQIRHDKIQQLKQNFSDYEDKIKYLTQHLETSTTGKLDSVERDDFLKEKAKNDVIINEYKQEILLYKDCNPKQIRELQNKADLIKESINVWTDNLDTIRSWLARKFYVDESEINKQFNIPENINYIT